MVIKIARTVKYNGQPRAFSCKVNGIKYPQGRNEMYFTWSKDKAIDMALKDYLEGTNRGRF